MRSARPDATTPRFVKRVERCSLSPRRELVRRSFRKLGNGLADQTWVADEASASKLISVPPVAIVGYGGKPCHRKGQCREECNLDVDA